MKDGVGESAESNTPTKSGDEKDLKISFKLKKKFILFTLVPVLVVALLLYGLIRQGFIGGVKTAIVAVAVQDAKNAPIPDAQVVIEDVLATTDKDGKATLTAKVGKRVISAKKTGFLSTSKEIRVKRGDNDAGVLQLADAPDAKVDISLKVTDYISGEEIKDAIVKLNDLKPGSSGSEYAFSQIPIGDYDVMVSKAGYDTFTSKVSVTKDTKELDPVALVASGRIVFESNREGGKRGIFTANYDGGDQKALVERSGNLEDYSPVLGPNQRKVFFISTRDGVKNDSGDYKTFLYLVDLDGKNLTKLGEYSDYSAVWSPDGGFIGYSRYDTEKKASELYVYDVIKKTTTEFDGYKLTGGFVFSQDGSKVAFSASKETGSPRLYTANSNGGDIVDVDIASYSLEFTANGLLRYSNYDSAGQKTNYYTYNLGTKERVGITAPEADKEGAILSPDKKLRAYISTRDGKRNVYISDADGKNEKKLTDLNKVAQGDLLWSLGSNFIMFNFSDNGEAARYLVSTNAIAKPKKIVDINLTSYGYGY